MSNVESRVSDGMGRDGTSCCPFVQGQKENPSPVVPLSRDNGRSKNSGRIFSVPGRSNTKSITQWQKNLSKKNKKFFKKVKNCIFFFSFTPSVLRPGPGLDRTDSQNISPARGNMSKSRTGLSRGKILSLSRCPCVPGQ